MNTRGNDKSKLSEQEEKISVIVPAYHEAPNLPLLAKRVKKALDGRDFEIIFSIDSNEDGSFQVAHHLEEKYEEVKALLSERRRGKTEAIVDGFRVSEGDIIVLIDADLQYPPETIPNLTQRIGTYDVVNGKRVKREDSLPRELESKAYNFLTSAFFRGHFEDNDSGLKVIRRQVFQDILPFLKERWHRYLLVLTAERGYDITEVPIPHVARKRGVSKFQSSPLKLFRGFLDLTSVKRLTSSIYFKGASGLRHLLRRLKHMKHMHGRREDLIPIDARKEIGLGFVSYPSSSPSFRTLS